MLGLRPTHVTIEGPLAAIELWDPLYSVVPPTEHLSAWFMADISTEMLTDRRRASQVTAFIEAVTSTRPRVDQVHATLARLLEGGILHARFVRPSWAEQARGWDHGEEPRPLNPNEPDEPAVARPTWISLEVVHHALLSTAGVELLLATAAGREIQGRLDVDGRWRCDEVDRGSCRVLFLDHSVLRRRERREPSVIEPQEDDRVWLAGSSTSLGLTPGQHHRIVVVQPPRPYLISA